MFESHLKSLRLLLFVFSLLFIFSCDDDDPVDQDEDSETIIGTWTFESQTLEFYQNGTKLTDSEVALYFSILGYDIESFQVPEGATFEFSEDGTFTGNATDYDEQTGTWELSDDESTLKIYSDAGILFLDIDSLPEDIKDLILEEDGSIAFEVLTLTETNASFYISKTGPIQVSNDISITLRTDLTINLTK